MKIFSPVDVYDFDNKISRIPVANLLILRKLVFQRI